MANKRIIKLTNTEAIVKVDGEPGLVTIDLDTDLVLPTEEAQGTQLVNIVSMQISGKPGSFASIMRNNENLWDLQSASAEKIDLLDIGGVTDSVNNSHNIVVTMNGAEGQLLLKLRKVAGYKTKLQPDTFGPYDNPGSITS